VTIAAIILADFRIRFRRLSTLVIFLLLSAVAYAWVPAPSTGRTLLQINGQRALYNSAAVGMATAALCGLFIGLVGFYVISNTIGRDARSRCGFVIASTNAGSLEYLIGKFAGNVVFLTTFTFGFMCSAMTMIPVRGEAPLEPLIFAKQYLLIVPPVIVSVSAIALLFESIPFLAGRFGDVAYFFVWTMLLAVTVTNIEGGGSRLFGAFDISGLGFMIDTLRHQLHTTSVAVGATSFNPRKGTFLFHGLSMTRAWIVPRLLSMLMPVPLLLLARLFFHRFDPVRVKQSVSKQRDSLFARINRLFKPLTRAAMTLVTRGDGPSLLRSAIADAILTTSATPLLAIAAIGISIAAIAVPFKSSGPIAIAAMGIAVAGVASRETQSGTSALAFAAPFIQPRFVAFKMLSTLFVLLPFAIVPAVRLALDRSWMLLTFTIGVLFLAAAATFLGFVSSNAKTFTVLFLTFWYVAVNDKGASPSLDFAGFNSSATPIVTGVYALLAIALIGAAQMTHAMRTT